VKILAINASQRGERGMTHYLIEILFRGALAAGADCREVVLAGMKIEPCRACAYCEDPAHPRRCVHDGHDDVRSVFDLMAVSDLIIYATPVYIFSMSRLLKTFLERLKAAGDSRDLRVSRSGLFFHAVDPAICSKPFVTLVCCDNNETETTRGVVEYFRTYSRFMDAPLAGELVRRSAALIQRPAEFPAVKDVLNAFEQAGRELALLGRVRPFSQRRANRDIIPVPFFSLLKRLRLKPLKKKFVERARLWQ